MTFKLFANTGFFFGVFCLGLGLAFLSGLFVSVGLTGFSERRAIRIHFSHFFFMLLGAWWVPFLLQVVEWVMIGKTQALELHKSGFEF